MASEIVRHKSGLTTQILLAGQDVVDLPRAGPRLNSKIHEECGVSISERKQELKRRRHRRKKVKKWDQRVPKATVSERAAIADKVRRLTPGAEEVIARWGIEER